MLQELIKYHVVKGALTTEDLYAAGDIGTLLFEEPIEFDITKRVNMEKRGPMDTDSVILMPDIEICNSTIHIIDHMLYPAITSVQGILDSEDGVFRSFVLIPQKPLISFKNVEMFANDVLGEEKIDEDVDEEKNSLVDMMDMLAPQSEKTMSDQNL